MRFQLKMRLVPSQQTEFSGVLDLSVNRCRCIFHIPDCSTSTFLPPFAPRPLRRFITTMKALTPVRVSLHAQTSLLNAHCLPDHSVPKHPVPPCRRFYTLRGIPQRDRSPTSFSVLNVLLPSWVQASPLNGRLAETPGRNGFALLRTGRSPPVASHPASQRRSYSGSQK